MPKNPLHLCLYGLGVFLLDRTGKYLASLFPEYTTYIIPRWLGWEYFENTGIAFGLPIPNTWQITLTLVCAAGAFLYIRKQNILQEYRLLVGIMLLCVGAFSNLVDRILFGFTIDYLRIFTAIINVADISIICGISLILFKRRRKPEA